MNEEKRNIRRQRVLKGGKIIVGGGKSVFDCVIRNISIGGAQLELASTVGIPDSFTLVETQSGKARRVTVAWRKGTRIGVSFSDPASDKGS